MVKECKFNIGDKVRLILTQVDGSIEYSDSEYQVTDIIKTESQKTGDLFYKIRLIDMYGNNLYLRDENSIVLKK